MCLPQARPLVIIHSTQHTQGVSIKIKQLAVYWSQLKENLHFVPHEMQIHNYRIMMENMDKGCVAMPHPISTNCFVFFFFVF